MVTVNPYLNFNGNTEKAFAFYKSVFGGEFNTLQRFKDMPDADKLSARDKDRILHVALPLGNGSILMASDTTESMEQKLSVGTNIHLSAETTSKEEAVKIFKGLSDGGKVTMPLADTFWGSHFGMVTDKFGIQWLVSYTYPKPKK